MSYKKGDLKVTIEKCPTGECDGDTDCIHLGVRFWVSDSREKYPGLPPYEKHGAYLPHSCDEWYIGGEEELEAFKADINEALEKLRMDQVRGVLEDRLRRGVV